MLNAKLQLFTHMHGTAALWSPIAVVIIVYNIAYCFVKFHDFDCTGAACKALKWFSMCHIYNILQSDDMKNQCC